MIIKPRCQASPSVLYHTRRLRKPLVSPMWVMISAALPDAHREPTSKVGPSNPWSFITLVTGVEFIWAMNSLRRMTPSPNRW
jgi:hypothetical protein